MSTYAAKPIHRARWDLIVGALSSTLTEDELDYLLDHFTGKDMDYKGGRNHLESKVKNHEATEAKLKVEIAKLTGERARVRAQLRESERARIAMSGELRNGLRLLEETVQLATEDQSEIQALRQQVKDLKAAGVSMARQLIRYEIQEDETGAKRFKRG